MIHDVVIYKANETNFNHEGLGVLIDFVEDVEVTENNRGFFELKFTYSLNGKLAQSIKEEAYIKTVANERQEEPLIFRIYQCEPDYIERLIYVRARLKIIDDMMNSVHKSIVFPKSFGITPIIEGLFKNAVPSLNYRLSGSVNNLHDISHEDDTVYEHLFQENGLFVMNDITPLYTPLGMTVTTTRGNKRVDTITEQDFINKFKIIRERKNMITAIIPWTVTKRDEFIANEEDARRSYRDTVEEKVYGEIIVSPKVASHGYPFIAKFMEFKNEVTREWEENNRTMREYRYQSVEDLNKASQNFFTENKGIDEYSIEASIETLGLHMDYMKRLSSLGLYDEVEFYLEEHDLKIVLAVSEVTYSPSLDMNLALTFQSNTSTLSKAGQRINANAPSERDLQNLIERERLKEIVRNYIDKDDGTRTYWVSELPDPSTAMEQDIAFLETAEGKSIWVLINGVWVEKLPLNFEERLRDELERIDTQTQAMEEAIQANEAKAREAFEQAGASADLATEAQRIADETKQAHASLSQEVSEAKADLVQKGLELSRLTENFGITERKVEELDGAIKETVTRTDYDALTGRVSQAETIIQSQAGEISQRLTRTQVESAITGKGYQTKSQVDSNITGRGYITNSALTPYATTVSVENKVRETADGINRTITEVRGLIPTEIGGANLIRNSGDPKNTDGWTSFGQLILTSHQFYFSGQKTLFSLRTTSTTAEAVANSPSFKVKRNTDYTLSFVIFNNSAVSGVDVWFLARKVGETANFTSTKILVSNKKFSTSLAENIIVTFNSGDNDEAYIRFDNNKSIDGSLATVYFGDVMLVEGTIARKWEPALEDLMLPFESFKNEYDRTAKHVIDNLSSVIQTDSQWYTTINNRLRTAEGNFDTLSRTTMPNLIDSKIAADNQIKDTRNDNHPPQWYWTNYPKQTVEELKLSSVIGVSGSMYAKLTTEVHWHDASAGKVKQTAKTDTGTYERQGTRDAWDAWVKTANATDLNLYTPLTTFQTVQTTTDLYERILGKTEGDIQTNASRLVMTSDVFQTEITNTLRGNIIENGAFMTTTDQWSGVVLTPHSFYKDRKANMFVITTDQASEKTGSTKRYKVKRNTDYSFSSIVFAGSNVSSVDIFALGRRTGETSNFTIIRQLIRERKASPSTAEYWTGTFNTGEMDELFLQFDNNGSTNGLNASLFFTEVCLVEGSIPKPWTMPIAETAAMSTKVTQLAGSWAVQNLDSRDKILSELILTDKLFKANISASEDMSLYNNLIDNTADFSKALPPTTFMTPGIAYEAAFKEPHDLYLAKGSATGTVFTIRFKLNSTVYPYHNPYLTIDWVNLGSARFRLENGAYTAWLQKTSGPTSMLLPKPTSNATYLEMQFQGDGMLIKPRSFILSVGGVKVPWRDARDNKTYSTAGFDMTTDGIRLKGEVIELDGNVRFDEAFGNKLFVDGLKANHIESMMGVFGKIIATNIDAQYITTNMLTAIEGAFKSANSTLQLNGDRMLIDSLYSWDLLIDRRGLSITNAAGDPLGSFVGAIDKETRLDNGIAMIAERNFTASLGYRGSNLDNVFESALTVNGTTGDITLLSGLKPHSSNPFKLELVGQSINLGKVYNSVTRQMEDNIIRGVAWKCGNTRVAFMENGLVYVSTASGDMRAL